MTLDKLFKGRYRGLKIGFLGLALGYVGIRLGIHTEQKYFFAFFFIGFLVMAIGLAIHYKDWKKGLDTPPEELYKKAKQPWEKDDV